MHDIARALVGSVEREDDVGGVAPARRIVAMDPAMSRRNDFINLFRRALEDTGVTVVPFNWTWKSLFSCDIVLLHWPRSFFDADVPRRRAIKEFAKLLAFRWIARGRLVWVVHNLDHHETGGSPMARRFVRIVDGFLFLSRASMSLFDGLYSPRASATRLVSVHGRYPGITAPCAWVPPTASLRLLHFGLIRSYKNIEDLMDRWLEWSPGAARLTIAGARVDQALASRIEALGQARPDLLSLDIRDTPLGEADLESIIDRHDAVILPYRQILNSGSALLALSRNRPVIAPAIGGMPELRDAVGSNWLYLYDGDFTVETLRKAVQWIRDVPRSRPDLSAYGWERITGDLATLLAHLRPNIAAQRHSGGNLAHYAG